MNLYEYQAKRIFSKFSLPILDNWVCSDMCEVENFLKKVPHSPPWVLKCQIRSGGRGKSGGVLISHSLKDILSFSKQWLGKYLITSQTTDVGERVEHILIEPAINIVREFYFSTLIDRNTNQVVCIGSARGGIDIEKLIHDSPDQLFKITVDPEIGAYPYQGRIMAYKLGLTGNQINKFVSIFINVVRMLLEKDLILVEINPLAVTHNNDLICLDAKISVDHNAFFRQSLFLNEFLEINKAVHEFDTKRLLNVNYVALDGNIGCMVNGAGLAMATMDLMQSLGGTPANFLDIGGDTDKKYIVSALKMLLKNTQVKAVLVNIFGGIVCCDLVADSVITAVSEYASCIPIVVRLEGNNAILGMNRLLDSRLNIVVINNLIYAIKRVIELVR